MLKTAETKLLAIACVLSDYGVAWMSPVSTEHQQRMMEELAAQLHDQLRRRGVPEPEARSQVASALELWGRVFERDRPH
jgi:hypothetical protein